MDFQFLQGLIPEYQYWPVAGGQPFPQTRPTGFADGGNLDNSGINAMLSYSDIDYGIAFFNSSTPIAAASLGMIGADGKEAPNTRVIITSDIPPLFGYQPYNPQAGYVLYKDHPNPTFPQGSNSQVFESHLLADVIQGCGRRAAAARTAAAPSTSRLSPYWTTPGSESREDRRRSTCYLSTPTATRAGSTCLARRCRRS